MRLNIIFSLLFLSLVTAPVLSAPAQQSAPAVKKAESAQTSVGAELNAIQKKNREYSQNQTRVANTEERRISAMKISPEEKALKITEFRIEQLSKRLGFLKEQRSRLLKLQKK